MISLARLKERSERGHHAEITFIGIDSQKSKNIKQMAIF